MYYVTKTVQYKNKKVKVLFDVRNTMPVLLPLIYCTSHTSAKSLSHQKSSFVAIKAFYEYWQQKYGCSFCKSFVYDYKYNLDHVFAEIPSFTNFLETGKDVSMIGIALLPSKISYSNFNPNTISTRLESLASFLRFLANRYSSIKYQNLEPNIAVRNRDKLLANLKLSINEQTGSLSSKRSKNIKSDFKSLPADVFKNIQIICRPSSNSFVNQLNPWKSKAVQWRNYLMIRLLSNYGLRASELLLLTVNSIKRNFRTENFSYSLVVTNSEEDDKRSSDLSIKTEFSHRTLGLSDFDYKALKMYCDLYRGKTKHDFLFTSTRLDYPPLSYQQLFKITKDIESKLKIVCPESFDKGFLDYIDSFSPHVFRHTWATMTISALHEAIHHTSPNKSSKSKVADEAKDQLRALAGWSITSNMPNLYAKRFIVESANIANIKRISGEHENYMENLINVN